MEAACDDGVKPGHWNRYVRCFHSVDLRGAVIA